MPKQKVRAYAETEGKSVCRKQKVRAYAGSRGQERMIEGRQMPSFFAPLFEKYLTILHVPFLIQYKSAFSTVRWWTKAFATVVGKAFATVVGQSGCDCGRKNDKHYVIGEVRFIWENHTMHSAMMQMH